MRQKAAAAWKSIASESGGADAKHALEVEAILMAADRRRKSVVKLNHDREQPSRPHQEEHRHQDGGIEEGDISSERRQQQHAVPLFFDAFDGMGSTGLGIVMADMEKRALASGRDFGVVVDDPAKISVLPSYAHRPRQPKVITRGRVLVAIGMLCAMGVISTLWSHRGLV
ncbi:hypothetical protein JX265_011745 [Neoarthrinium moseri]|uniref:Uncharacterized protein n=1 Tax=Neoarthrinium moseri TaxID=1658444 RepID=A0A9Q0AK97_9PEZI|nr:hypothetical protein JX265_011745 [Neoarthrinium moseri]